jgi:hypothetical protein
MLISDFKQHLRADLESMLAQAVKGRVLCTWALDKKSTADSPLARVKSGEPATEWR